MNAVIQPLPPPHVTIVGDDEAPALEGALVIGTIEAARAELKAWLRRGKPRTLGLDGLSSLDTPGALLLCELRDRDIELTGVRPEHQELLALIGGLERKPLPQRTRVPRWRQLVIQIGRGSESVARDTLDIVSFVGRSASAIVYAATHPTSVRWAAISRQIAETGINALPIVGLTAIMISIVIGYQSVAQLRPYGGEDYTINLVAVSVLREMGVLITAIMVAGRTGSAYTAEIGVMKAREEVDALAVMGLRPFDLLVVPRLLGLIITLPLLTFFADLMGLLGGALIAGSLMHIEWPQYLDRVRLAVDTSDLFVGLVKAPVFAFFIGAVGCMHGMKVRGSAESVGRETTSAVVKAIFLVIVFDALFSVLFEQLGL